MSTNPFRISLILTGPGSFCVSLSSGQHRVEMVGVSYATDVVGDLVRAGVRIACYDPHCSFSFDGEPTEWRFIAQANIMDNTRANVTLRVLQFRDALEKLPDEMGDDVFSCEMTRDEFGNAVKEAALELLNHYGPAGYNEHQMGMNHFPLRALVSLNAALKVNESSMLAGGEVSHLFATNNRS